MTGKQKDLFCGVSDSGPPLQGLRILCLGAGYTTLALARFFPALDIRYLSRGGSKEKAIDSSFVPDLVLDSIPPVLEDGRLTNPLYRSEWEQFPRAIYAHLSSTAVYSTEPEATRPVDVDESSPAHPDDDRGKGRLALEDAILSYRPHALILRCGGIYGPGRSLPLSIARGQSGHMPVTNRFISRIHVHDLCRLIVTAAERLKVAAESGWAEKGQPPSLFAGHSRPNLICAVDPNPTPAAVTAAFIRSEWGLAMDEFSEYEKEHPRGRRVRSLYAPDLLGSFDFPDFRDGFRESMREFRRD